MDSKILKYFLFCLDGLRRKIHVNSLQISVSHTCTVDREIKSVPIKAGN